MVPPNDDLFEPAPAGVTPEPVAPAAAPAPAGTAGGLTPDQIDARIAERTGALSNDLSALRRENDALKLAVANAQQAPAPTTPSPSGDEFVAHFNRDPSGAIKSIADQASSEGLRQLAPHLNKLIGSANSAFLGAEQTRIEERFGTKAWQEVYQPVLAERFAAIRREDPFAVGDINRVRMEVDLVTGANFDKLSDYRNEHVKGRGAATEAERKALIEEARRGITTNLSGGIRSTPKGALPELDDGLKEAIADMDRHTGRRTDTAEFAKNMLAAQNARDVDEWLALTKPPVGTRAN
jgi:hypothetical protein